MDIYRKDAKSAKKTSLFIEKTLCVLCAFAVRNIFMTFEGFPK